MKYLSCIILLSVIVVNSYGQYNYYQTEYTFQSRANGMMTQLPPAPKEKVSSAYLYEDFYSADIYFRDSTVYKDMSVKLDLMNNVLDIKFNNEIKMLPIKDVLALSIRKADEVYELFVSSSTIPMLAAEPPQLCRVLKNDLVSLYGKPVYSVIEASRNEALNLNHEAVVTIRTKYFFTYKESLVEIKNKSKLKADLTLLMGSEVEVYLKKVNTKSESDLLLLAGRLSDLKRQNNEDKGVVN